MKRKAKAATGEVGKNGCVSLELTHPGAQSVAIAGSFNDWHPTVTPMIALGEGRWRKELTLPPGRYEYRLVVDGQWVDDPAAKETVPNPFGGMNAVLNVVNQNRSGEKHAEIRSTQRWGINE
jgi:1,4-alpha-glucan branching enzyme